MSTIADITDHSGIVSRPHLEATGNDPYIRVKDILVLRRSHLPEKAVRTTEEPETLDAIRVVSQRQTHQYRFVGAEQWAAYKDIQIWEQERRSPRSHTRAPTREMVFAAVKIVLAERDRPLRAVLTYEAICPTRGNLGVPRPGASLWLVYAALAMFNSSIGQALYRQYLEAREGRSRTPSGLSMDVLQELPVAATDTSMKRLERVAHLAHQVSSLYEAQRECAVDLHHAISAIHEKLLGEVCLLLRLSEQEARDLLSTTSDVVLDDYRQDVQLKLFDNDHDIPPLPPVDLLGAENRKHLQELDRYDKNGGRAPGNEAARTHLRCLRLWEDRLRTLPPRRLDQTESKNHGESGLQSFPLEQMQGVRTPVSLVRESVSGDLYEYYPLGEHLVAAPGVCGGRATFKYTRLDVRHVLSDLNSGSSDAEVMARYAGSVSPEALEEARALARQNPIELFEKRLAPSTSGR